MGMAKVQAYRGDLLWRAWACAVCVQDGIDQRCHHRDTTRCSRPGASLPDRDEPAMHRTHGDSKAPRPDLKQAVWERLVAQGGGSPCVSKSGDGLPSAPPVFQKRAAALRRPFPDTPSPRSLVAEATLAGEDEAAHRARLGVITRMPATLTVVAPVMGHALPGDTWQALADHPRSQSRALDHAGMAQREHAAITTPRCLR